MAAYAIYNLNEVLDPDALSDYVRRFPPTLEKYGGRRIASDPNLRVLEGTWDGIQTVIIEFPDMDALVRWHGSDEYRPFIQLRQNGARGTMIALQGL
jgi:uncharacterized protein (DUF1330 family)